MSRQREKNVREEVIAGEEDTLCSFQRDGDDFERSTGTLEATAGDRNVTREAVEGDQLASGGEPRPADGVSSALTTDSLLLAGTGEQRLSEGPFECRLQAAPLVPVVDLRTAMRERHGWSVPWLPGLWRMPDGQVFGHRPGQSSLLMALQLYFEKGSCPCRQPALTLRSFHTVSPESGWRSAHACTLTSCLGLTMTALLALVKVLLVNCFRLIPRFVPCSGEYMTD
jgi:hypothetical protein